jgi:hypothetical protein
MFRWPDAPPLEVRALLERERSIPALPATVRARALARARAALAGPRLAECIAAANPPHTIRWATAAGLVFLAALGGGAAAYELGVRAQPTVAPAPRVRPLRPALRAAERPADFSPPPRPTPPSPSRSELAREELHLIERARAAVAQDDFAAAMLPLAEHARRFKDGRLAEEREALRVTALAELGRAREAHRAIAAFERRFPRSPLLPAVRRMAAAGQ